MIGHYTIPCNERPITHADFPFLNIYGLWKTKSIKLKLSFCVKQELIMIMILEAIYFKLD